MTGIERLRKLSEDLLSLNLWIRLTTGTEKDWDCCQGDGRTVNDELLSIADQIEREARAPFSLVRVLAVISDMKRRVSDTEGPFGALVERWARELRKAVGCREYDSAEDVSVSAYDLLPEEERNALVWVREHGGLDRVKAEWRSRVPYDKHERARQRLIGHIAECETALGRRNVRIDELGHRVNDLMIENAELRRRAMPEGYEWPRYEDGSPVVLSERDQRPGTVSRVAFVYHDAVIDYRSPFVEINPFVCETTRTRIVNMGERVRRPAVPAADGEPLEVGQTVWHVDTGDEFYVSCFSGGMVNVSDKKGGGSQLLPSQLTHTKPEPPDSWERIEEDIVDGFMDTKETACDLLDKAIDIVRRCKALAGDA